MTGEDDTGADEDGQAGEVAPWWHSQPLGLWWVLPIGLVAAGWLLLEGRVRLSGYTMGGTLALAALLRLLLPRDMVGGLMVRSRTWDVLVLLGLAIGVTVISAALALAATAS